jgi:hypothetical protein
MHDYCCVTMDHHDELAILTHYFSFLQWLHLLSSTCLILGFLNLYGREKDRF